MRTTVTLEDDVAAAIEALRRERGIGLSEALNTLVREGLTAKPDRRGFKQRTFEMGARIDLSNVAEALETAEGPNYR